VENLVVGDPKGKSTYLGSGRGGALRYMHGGKGTQGERKAQVGPSYTSGGIGVIGERRGKDIKNYKGWGIERGVRWADSHWYWESEEEPG